MTDYSAGSGDEHVEQRQALASLWALITNAWQAFRIWQRTRPFWGGLLIIAGASEMLASEQAPLPVVTRIGIRGLGGYLTPTFMLLCGVLLWVTSIARTYHSLIAIVLAINSWLTSNLGGFLIGMLVGVVGGALAFAWMTDDDFDSAGWLRGIPKIRFRSWASNITSLVQQLRARQSEGRGLAATAGSVMHSAITSLRTMSPMTAAISRAREFRGPRPRQAAAPRTNAPVQAALRTLLAGLDAGQRRITRWFTRGP